MVPYQIYKALADQRIHDRVAGAERHARLAAATRDSSDATRLSTRVEVVTSRIMAQFHVRRSANASSMATHAHANVPTMTSGSGAGPIGCSA